MKAYYLYIIMNEERILFVHKLQLIGSLKKKHLSAVYPNRFSS